MTPPSTIAHYRITAKLGEGGMGAVYRATDTKLNRDVAIKVLPDSFAADPDRLARFTREAQVLASLNHPNIAAIYGVEERAIVLELVEGAEPKGPLTAEEMLPLIRQLIDALEYAHEKGIVHRDLKPANLKATPEGSLKVLDFGLAKALSTESTITPDQTSSPTLTMRATMAGVIMGTPAYMAPEQARGQAVDRRADIWSFGVIVYELLTGKHLFHAPTVSDTLASVLMREPDLTAVPPRFHRLLRLCLARDPRQRLRDISGARLLLDEPEPAATAGRPWRWMAAAGVFAAACLILAAFLWHATRSVDRPMQRFSADLGPDTLTGLRTTAIISPDGKRLVFLVKSAIGNMLGTRLMDQSKATVLAGTENAVDPFFSPDGQWVGFSAEQKLKKVSVTGGATVTLCELQNFRGAAWGEDGNIYAALDASHVFRVSEAGGRPQPVSASAGPNDPPHRWPQILPGGKTLLVTTGGSGAFAWDDGMIEALSLETGGFKTVQRGGYFGRYLPSGHLVFMHQGTLFGVPFDLGRLETRGHPAPVQEEVAGATTSGGAQISFSRDGVLVYLSGRSPGIAVPAVWLEASGIKKPFWPAPPGPINSPRLSPDGSRLAAAIGGDNYTYEAARGALLRLTFNPTALNADPIWTPDGKHIVFSAVAGGVASLWWIRSDGSGQPQQIYESKTNGAVVAWSFTPDGKRLAFHQVGTGTSTDIWTLPLDLSDPDHPKALKPELFLAGPALEVDPTFSPDGRWLAYSSNESGPNQVYVRPFPPSAAGGKWQVSTTAARFPVWSRASKELFYISGGRIMVVPYATAGETFAPGPPRRWSDVAMQFTGNSAPYDIAPDGKRFVVLPAPDNVSAPDMANVHVTFLLNFFDELKRRMP